MSAIKLTDLPNWGKLTKEEKQRLQEVFKNRIEQNYNLAGELSTSKKELRKVKPIG